MRETIYRTWVIAYGQAGISGRYQAICTNGSVRLCPAPIQRRANDRSGCKAEAAALELGKRAIDEHIASLAPVDVVPVKRPLLQRVMGR
jgi:hypothetical protein